MESLLTLAMLALLLFLAGFAIRRRERIFKWLNCTTAAYEDSATKRKTMLKRRAEDAQAEIAYIEKMEEAETQGKE